MASSEVGGALVRQTDLTVEVRDKNLVRKGAIHHRDLTLKLTDPHNNVGSWELSLSSEHPMAPHLRTPGSGIIIYNGAQALASGPTAQPEFTSIPSDPKGTLKFTGFTDDVVLADRLAWPFPSSDLITDQTGKMDTRSGAAETVIHEFVNANVGDLAPASRRDERLSMGTNLARGPLIKKSASFDILGELIGGIAKVADLGFRVVQRGAFIGFETYAIADKRNEIRLDVLNGTLAAQKLTINAPEVTHAIVMGKGRDKLDTDPVGYVPPKEPHLYTTTDSLAAEVDWNRRIERVFNASSTRDPDELKQAGLEALTDKGSTAISVQVSPLENDNMRFITDWGVGDRVIVIVDGNEYTSLCTGLQIRADKDGFFLGALLGDPADFDPRVALRKVVAQTGARISALERNG